jgi:hypothetical protein
MHAKRSSSRRSARFTLRIPLVTGVSTGPLRATPFERIDASVDAGSGSPIRAKMPAPIS